MFFNRRLPLHILYLFNYRRIRILTNTVYNIKIQYPQWTRGYTPCPLRVIKAMATKKP